MVQNCKESFLSVQLGSIALGMSNNPRSQESAVMAILEWWDIHRTDRHEAVMEDERKRTLRQLAKLMDSRSAKVKSCLFTE